MGQTATKESPDEFLPPVQTREELYERLKWRLWKDCLGDVKHEWFRAIFQIFCTESESEKCTSESIVDFMGVTLYSLDGVRPAGIHD